MKVFLKSILLASAGIALSVSASAKEVSVKMLNQSGGEKYVFDAELVRLKPGDSLVFEATDRGHNAETIPGMLPQGAKRFKTGFNKSETVTFSAPGIYGVKCLPHFGLGMIAFVIVGDPVNLEEVKTDAEKLPPKAKARALALLEQVK